MLNKYAYLFVNWANISQLNVAIYPGVVKEKISHSGVVFSLLGDGQNLTNHGGNNRFITISLAQCTFTCTFIVT